MTERKAPTYKARAIDLAWARNVVNMLSDGGVIGYPSTELIYRINKKAKELVLTNPEKLFHLPSFITHYQTIDVFKQIGYTVLPGKEEP